jgi:hypothetical protein
MSDSSDSDMSETSMGLIPYHSIQIIPTTDEASVAFYQHTQSKKIRMMLEVTQSNIAAPSTYGNRRVSTAPQMEISRITMVTLKVPKAFVPVIRKPGCVLVGANLMKALYRSSVGDTASKLHLRRIHSNEWHDYEVEETVSLSVVHSVTRFDTLELTHEEVDEFFGLYISIDPIFDDFKKELIRDFLHESFPLIRED